MFFKYASLVRGGKEERKKEKLGNTRTEESLPSMSLIIR